ncbi:hypothetical protein RND81_09G046500 [Saponaria officinalis]|uniref:Tf2-1-like SH3-like domain-containing protein n=1 Tax=Saponaria officinalis TaxID=3572 RepID=A0AAW1II22_SAPOF
MKHEIQEYIKKCPTCQQCKYDVSAYPGKLQPLSIPSTLWTEVSMDTIDGFPKYMGNDSILVVFDRLNKTAYFIPLKHPYSAPEVAQAYFNTVYKSDGQTEVLNRCLETYLRCFFSETPSDWCKWIPAAEFWYNTSYHYSLKCSPYEVLYEQPPPVHLPYMPGKSRILWEEDVTEAIQEVLWLLQNSKKKGHVAYKLELPHTAQIHHTFHVSLLKKCHGTPPAITALSNDNEVVERPELVMARKTVKRERISATKVLVKWTTSELEDAILEFLYDLQLNYPDFDPWGQRSVQGEGADTDVTADTLILGANRGNAKNDSLMMETH